jgi:hypothetical protein
MTEVNEDSDMLEVKTNEDIFFELKKRNESEKKTKKLKMNTMYNSSYGKSREDSTLDQFSKNQNNISSVNNAKSNNHIHTFESCTSSEFRKEIGNNNDSGFISNTRDLNNLKININ